LQGLAPADVAGTPSGGLPRTGLTPEACAGAHPANRVREKLGRRSTVTEAIYDAGFNSNGRFYKKSTDILGMTPTQYRAGGTAEVVRFAVGQCSLGAILVASSEKGVASILIGDNPDAWFVICRIVSGTLASSSAGIVTLNCWSPAWWI
jgi:AraC family transcriptional regulator of adaptative response/methylated-DNA-[protein]-cysteine methyltransferase